MAGDINSLNLLVRFMFVCFIAKRSIYRVNAQHAGQNAQHAGLFSKKQLIHISGHVQFSRETRYNYY